MRDYHINSSALLAARNHLQRDKAGRGQSDAVTYATRALESTIKIISDEHGWSTGSERGAVNYVE